MTAPPESPPELPGELVADWEQLHKRWCGTPLEPWLATLPEQLRSGLSEARFGDLPRWRQALADLPELPTQPVLLDQSRVGLAGSAPASTLDVLQTALMGLHPWRKGPFELCGLHVDTEWRSDWKWNRLSGALRSLSGKRVLDVGCGNGYHCWRMLGAGASEVIGIDPTPLFVLQFKALQHYLRQPAIHVLPMTLEHMPDVLPAFDTVFSMGVLYHRRDPMEHLLSLHNKLIPGGQLILETLVIEGNEEATLEPNGRYARMGNVWQVPSAPLVQKWLRTAGFQRVELIDAEKTSVEEQRRTQWMTFHSLAEFLDPENDQLTIEGFPAPRRALFTAEKPH